MISLEMKCPQLSKPEATTIVRLQKHNKSIREIAGTLGVAKSTVWYILGKKDVSSVTKRPRGSPRTTVVDNWRILSVVKKKNLPQHPAKRRTFPGGRRHCQSLQSRCKQGQIRLCQKTSDKNRPLLKLRSTCTIMNDENKKVWRILGTAHDQSIPHYL